MGRGLEHVPAELGEHLPFVRNTAWQDHIEGTDPFRGHQNGAPIGQVVHIAHLAPVDGPHPRQIHLGAH